MPQEISISAKRLRTFGYAVFRRVGVGPSIYKSVVDALVETSLRGVDSHGVRLLPHYVHAVMVGRIKKDASFSFCQTSPSTGIVDADHGFGIAAGVFAMDHAIGLARDSGMGGVAVKQSSHFGAAATYGLRAAKKNMIGMAFTDVDSLVFPYGGKQTYFGTNPICFTAPMEGEEPFCLDMATTLVPLNKILAYRAAGRILEPGWAADAQGNPTSDPQKAVSPIPIGAHKGYGLAMMVAILSSLLVGAPFGNAIPSMFPLNGKRRNLGHFFLAINIAAFRPVKQFKKDIKVMAQQLRAIPPVDPMNHVMVLGDPEKKMFSIRSKKGIPVPKHDIHAFTTLGSELGFDAQRILFS